MLIKPTDIIYLPFPGLMVPNRDFKMPWHRPQREHQKTIGFIGKTTILYMHDACLYISLPIFAWLPRENA